MRICFLVLGLWYLSGCSEPLLRRPPPLPVAEIPTDPSKQGLPRWIFEASERIVSTPKIGPDGTIYISSLDYTLFAIRPDGQRKWSFTVDDLVLSSPETGIDGTIYITSKDHYLYAIHPGGLRKWRFLTQGAIDSSPRIGFDGTIYVASNDSSLYALDANGRLLWSFRAYSGFHSSTPAIGSDGSLFIGSVGGYLYAIDPQGKKRWERKICDKIVSSPIVDPDGTVFLGCVDGNLHAFSSGGTSKWKFETKGPIFSTPILGRDGTVYVGSDDTWFYAIDPKTGQQKWNFRSGHYKKNEKGEITAPEETAGYIQAAAAISPAGRIYFGSVNEMLTAVTSEGKFLWQFDAKGWVDHAPIVTSHQNKEVIYVAGGRRLFALNP